MLSIMYRGVKDEKLKTVEKPFKGAWIAAVDPTAEEMKILTETLKIPKDFIIRALDPGEMPHVDREGGKFLLVIRVPVKEEDELTTMPLGIILGRDFIATVCKTPNDILTAFFKGPRGFYTTKRGRFVLQIFWLTVKYFLKYLNAIDRRLDAIEEKMKVRQSAEEILELFYLQKTLTYFKTAVAANQSVLEKVLTGRIFKLYEQDRDVLEDIIIDNKQALAMISTYIEVLANMRDSYSSAIEYNLNTIMKFLTAISIVIAVPTIISSIYGMNVLLPLQSHPKAFEIIILISFTFSLAIAWFFYRKGWL